MECLATFHIPSKEGVVINVKFDLEDGTGGLTPNGLKILAREQLEKFFDAVPVSYQFKNKPKDEEKIKL